MLFRKPRMLALEGTLWVTGLCCLGLLGLSGMRAAVTQQAAAEIELTGSSPLQAAHTGQLIGRLQIVQVGLSVPVLENYDSATLVRGVGHVPGTAVPGGLGNLVIAGHRDTFFRPLRHVQAGMEIRVVAPSGNWRYVIDRTEIVMPDQVRVLDIGDVPELTLITCYPFEFIGTAPKRFIVHAHLVSADPS